jgi:hypothetical protein
MSVLRTGSRLASFVSGNFSRPAARELSGDDRLSQQRPGTARQAFCLRFLLAPDCHPAQQLRRVQQNLHESNLINTSCEKKRAELIEAVLGEIAAAVQISTSWLIGFRQQPLILIELTRQAARDRP